MFSFFVFIIFRHDYIKASMQFSFFRHFAKVRTSRSISPISLHWRTAPTIGKSTNGAKTAHETTPEKVLSSHLPLSIDICRSSPQTENLTFTASFCPHIV
jgi:hypothetical protein